MRLCESGERVRVCIALEEALLNAFYHGNLEISSGNCGEGKPTTRITIWPNRARGSPLIKSVGSMWSRHSLAIGKPRYVIRDRDGHGFDPSQVADPRNPDNLDRPCGRGLLLMRTFMDEVNYNDVGE